MKNKIKQTSKKYIVIPAFTIGLMAMLVFASAEGVSAYNSSNSSNKGEFARILAEKFNLDQEQVEETIHEFRESKHEAKIGDRKVHLEERLEAAVSEGTLTEAQSFALLEKYEEMHNRLEELHDQDLSEEEMHEARADIHEEMEAWASEQGIDFDLFLKSGKKMYSGSKKYLMH